MTAARRGLVWSNTQHHVRRRRTVSVFLLLLLLTVLTTSSQAAASIGPRPNSFDSLKHFSVRTNRRRSCNNKEHAARRSTRRRIMSNDETTPAMAAARHMTSRSSSSSSSSHVRSTTATAPSTSAVNDKLQQQLLQQQQHHRDPIYRYSSLAAGIGSGIVSSLVVAPLDLIRTRLQVFQANSVGNAVPQTAWRMLRDILAREGAAGCFRGLTATLLTVPVFWGVYCTLLRCYVACSLPWFCYILDCIHHLGLC